MKKLLCVVVAVIAIGFSSVESKAQVGEGSVLFDAYYGYSLSTSFWKAFEIDGASGSNYSIVGPAGVRFEFMVSDVIGLGIDANFRDSEFSQTYESSGTNYETTYSVTQTRIMGRMNFHVATTEAVDYYFGFGLGYKSSDRSVESTEANFEDTVDFPSIPVAFRISTGLRYFFTDNVGAHFEVGIGGGSLATGGLSFKF
jgi:hypothetical protein